MDINMRLGSYEFYWNPEQFTMPKEEKSTGVVLTYTSAAYFSFGTFFAGKTIVLEWDWMPTTMWDELETMYLADVGYFWYPGDGNKYAVEIIALDGAFFEVLGYDSDYRKDVKMALLIKSVEESGHTTTSTTTTTTSSSTTTTTA